jgi:hypothetical protein
VKDKPAETLKTAQGTRKFRIWIINDVERIRKFQAPKLSVQNKPAALHHPENSVTATTTV